MEKFTEIDLGKDRHAAHREALKGKAKAASKWLTKEEKDEIAEKHSITIGTMGQICKGQSFNFAAIKDIIERAAAIAKKGDELLNIDL